MPLELVPAEHPNGNSRSAELSQLEQQLSPSSLESPASAGDLPAQPMTTIEQQLARIDAEADPQRRVQRLRELASALEHQHDDPARALTALLTAYREMPTRAAWSHLERLATITNNWSELATELAAAMDDLDAEDRANAWLHLGRIYERQLDHAEHALACYEHSLTLDPDCVAARNAVEATLRARGDHAALLTRLEERLMRAPELEQRAIRLELAGLYAQLGERGEAIGRYEALRRELPSELTILRALERLYDDARRVNDLVDVLETQAGLVDGARDRAQLYRRLAIEWEEQLGRADKAAECWQWLLSFDAASDEAYRALERLYSAEGNWRAAVDIYCRHAAVIVDAGERARLHTEVARICERQLEDAAGAIEFYR
ncbi:MAG TPA: hypothetical protein VIA18_15555, partial [Polyangia bacterium]|nr:hypothetical protein [Polyangia bacterium]